MTTVALTHSRIDEVRSDPGALHDLWREVRVDSALSAPERADALGLIEAFLDAHVTAACQSDGD